MHFRLAPHLHFVSIVRPFLLRSAMDRLLPGGSGHETLTMMSAVPAVCSSFFRCFEAPTGRQV